MCGFIVQRSVMLSGNPTKIEFSSKRPPPRAAAGEFMTISPRLGGTASKTHFFSFGPLDFLGMAISVAKNMC